MVQEILIATTTVMLIVTVVYCIVSIHELIESYKENRYQLKQLDHRADAQWREIEKIKRQIINQAEEPQEATNENI